MIVTFLFGALALSAPAPAADLPPESWWSFRNGNEQLGVAHTELPDQLEVLWKYPTEYGMAGAAAVVGERVYVPTLDGNLLCLARDSGELVWSYRSIDDPNPKAFAPGFKAAPTVTADAIYVGDEDGVFHAIDPVSGKQKWTFKTDAEIAGAATVIGDRVLFPSYDSRLYCVHAKDGSEAWSITTNDRINGTPATDGKHAFITGCDQHLRVINVETGEQTVDMPLETILIATPALKEGKLYFGTHDAEILCVDWAKQSVVWRYRADGDFRYHSSAAVTDEYVVAGCHDKQVHCVRRADGEGVWAHPTRAAVESSPVIVGDRVFVGSGDGHVYGLALADGKELWKHKLGRNVTASPAIGHGVMVIGAEGSGEEVYCFGKK